MNGLSKALHIDRIHADDGQVACLVEVDGSICRPGTSVVHLECFSTCVIAVEQERGLTAATAAWQSKQLLSIAWVVDTTGSVEHA